MQGLEGFQYLMLQILYRKLSSLLMISVLKICIGFWCFFYYFCGDGSVEKCILISLPWIWNILCCAYALKMDVMHRTPKTTNISSGVFDTCRGLELRYDVCWTRTGHVQYAKEKKVIFLFQPRKDMADGTNSLLDSFIILSCVIKVEIYALTSFSFVLEI